MADDPASIPSQNFVPLRGSHRELLPASRPAGAIDPTEVVSITVRTRSTGDVAELERRVRDMYSQPLDERRYLSRPELAQTYGAGAEDLDAVERYAQQHNLVVSERNAAQRSVVLTGTLGNLLSAFPADLHLFHHAAGSYRGRRGDIMIPRQFENVITGIFGFDTRPKHKAPNRSLRFAAGGPGGQNGVSPAEFAKRYNFPTQHQNTKLDGSGQCIAIIELGGGFNHTDLLVYFKEIGVALPDVTAISVDHAANHPTKTGAADGEVMLDIEVAGAAAPKAKIAVYFAPNRGNGFFDAIRAAVHDHERNPSVISISWGEPDDFLPAQSIQAFHELFVEAASLGITICAASGDHGTADLSGVQWDHKIHVDHPASDDLVLGCGGTQLDQQGNEITWNDMTPFANVRGGGGWATGGGVSPVFRQPAYQEQHVKIPASIDTGRSGRGVPDIAMSAENYFTRVQGADGPSGGTSAVAPLMAALVALLNQGKGKRVGFLNPFLYANVSKGVVKDITVGTNAIAGTLKGYDAGPGWDACTGLGTPDGQAILNNL